MQHINRTPCSRISRTLEISAGPKGRRKQGKAIKEASRRVSTERVNRSPNCVLAGWVILIMIMMIFIRYFQTHWQYSHYVPWVHCGGTAPVFLNALG